MPARGAPGQAQRLSILASTCIAVLALYLARDFLVPIIFAALLASVLLPVAIGLERTGLRRVFSVILVTVLAYALLGSVAWLTIAECVDLSPEIVAHADALRQKLSGLGLGQVITFIERLRSVPSTIAPAPPGPGEVPLIEPPPMPVRVVDPSSSISTALGLIVPVLRPFAIAGFASVIGIFLMLCWEDVRDRIIRLVSHGRMTLTAKALDDLSGSIARVLGLQLIVNVGVGLAVALALWGLGIPKPALWGVLAAMLRFIPYLGIAVAALLPALLAVAISDGWSLGLAILGLFLVVEVITGNVVEPLLQGSEAGVSTIALLIAASFWTWLWGLPGLFLATPITVGLAVIGRYVPHLAWLNILLGDAPALAPAARLYQRLVALDRDEAHSLVRAYLAAHDLQSAVEHLLFASLCEIEQARISGELDDPRADAMLDLVHELLESIADTSPAPRVGPAITAARNGAPPPPPSSDVLCIPARTPADEIAAAMVAALLVQRGHRARALAISELGDLIAIFTESAPRVASVVAAPPAAARHARIRERQIELRFPGIPICSVLVVEPGSGRLQPEATGPNSSTPSPSHPSALAEALERISRSIANTSDPAAMKEGGG